jgi:hypothetical protein
MTDAVTNNVAQERDKYNRFKPKFREEFIERAAELRRAGSTTAMVAADLGVSKDAVKKWKCPTSPYFRADFALAWEVASAGFDATYDRKTINEFGNPNFNAVLFSMFMRNNSDWTEHRKLDLKMLADAKTFSEQKTELTKLMKGEQVTAHEINYLTRCISDLNQLEQIENLQREVNELKLLMKKGFNHGQIDTESESSS